ncbi:N-acetyltransferase [Alkalihalobacillus oceani]|uniref:DapH/DapD/GlmU-related protein n=1 Tax=Halalkalibacter oceani TaxID=1653776 RepID=UPI002040F819|nr:DapH/DapD/GlmU-related protein [Halalkalibacter oceani]MCM3761870.1 N-acetyltransferase [Halalkalibacter oceani]
MSIDPTATLGNGCEIGEYVVIEEDVEIGDNVTIDHHVVIKAGTKIGEDVRIQAFTLLGKQPAANKKMARKPTAALFPLSIGNGVTIGSHVTLYHGSVLADEVFIGDHVSIREEVEVGRRSVIGRHVMVEPKTTIGQSVTVQTGCYVTADTTIEDFVFLGPCVSMSNDKYMASGKGVHTGPYIKKGAKLGNHATLLPSIIIGAGATVGAGAVVTKDVADSTVVVGNPARQK